jgi:Protein of unknown function (DUF4435)
MTTHLTRLIEARTSRITVINQFIRDYASINLGVFLFVEGKGDKTFYQRALRQNIPKNIKLKIYDCGNKAAVLKNEATISTRDLPRTIVPLYFVDRDFDDFIGGNRVSNTVFVTGGYSFENYIDNEFRLEQAWESGVNSATSGIDFDFVSRIFRRAYIKFASLMKTFSSEVICERLKNKDSNIILNNIKLTKVMHFNEEMELIIDSKALEELSNQVGLNTRATSKRCISDTVRSLELAGSRVYIRGKYLVKLFILFISKLQTIGKTLDRNFSLNFELSDRGVVNHILSQSSIPSEILKYVAARTSVLYDLSI